MASKGMGNDNSRRNAARVQRIPPQSVGFRKTRAKSLSPSRRSRARRSTRSRSKRAQPAYPSTDYACRGGCFLCSALHGTFPDGVRYREVT